MYTGGFFQLHEEMRITNVVDCEILELMSRMHHKCQKPEAKVNLDIP